MASASHVRLFIALWPTDPVRHALARWQAAWQWPERAAVVRPERLHVTLHFLGAVPSSTVLDLGHVLQIPTPAFEVQFGTPEMWQNGIAVVRPESAPTALRALHARIGLALASVGLKPESRPYRPHVTLARKAAGATPPPQPVEVAWPAKDGFVLVQTLGGGRGYEILERFGR